MAPFQLLRCGTAIVFAALVMCGASSAGEPDPISVLLPTSLPPPTGLSIIQSTPTQTSGLVSGTNNGNGLDEKWGESMSTDLFDSKDMHARMHYFYSAGHDGTQGGLLFSITVEN